MDLLRCQDFLLKFLKRYTFDNYEIRFTNDLLFLVCKAGNEPVCEGRRLDFLGRRLDGGIKSLLQGEEGLREKMLDFDGSV